MQERDVLKWIILKASEQIIYSLRLFDPPDMPVVARNEYEDAIKVKEWAEAKMNVLNGIAEGVPQ